MSIYNLTPEEGTALVRLLERGRMFMPDEAIQVQMYQHTRSFMREMGFKPYEISNYYRPLAEMETRCRHNLRYWTGGDYLGLGAGAHSFSAEGHLPPGGSEFVLKGVSDTGRPALTLPGREGGEATAGARHWDGGVRWATEEGLEAWATPLGQGRVPLAMCEGLSRAQGVSEMLLTRLRLSDGVDLTALSRLGGKACRQAVEARGRLLATHGLIEQHEEQLRLTEEGVLLVNSVIETLSLAADEALSEAS
jgi:oxygen-independent coproporphyrinogen-3 oxidase